MVDDDKLIRVTHKSPYMNDVWYDVRYDVYLDGRVARSEPGLVSCVLSGNTEVAMF